MKKEYLDKKAHMTIVAVFALIIWSWSPCFAANPAELVVEKHIQLPSPSDIKNIVLMETGDGNSIYFPVIERKDGIDFFNENAEKISSVQFEKPYGDKTSNQLSHSSNNKYISIHTTVAAESTRGDQDTITVYDFHGIKQWSAKAAAYGDYYVAPNGQYVVCIFPPVGYPNYPPCFVNANGVMNPSVYNYKYAINSNWDPKGMAMKFAFSDDSSLWAVGLRFDKDPGKIIVFNDKGELLFPIATDLHGLHNFAFGQNNKKLIFTGWIQENDDFSSLQIFNLGNHKIERKLKPDVRSDFFLNITELTEQLVVTSMRLNKVFCFNSDYKQEWTYSNARSDDFLYKQVKTLDKTILLSGHSRHDKKKPDEVILLSSKGIESSYKLYLKRNILEGASGKHCVLLTKGKIGVATTDGVDILVIPKLNRK